MALRGRGKRKPITEVAGQMAKNKPVLLREKTPRTRDPLVTEVSSEIFFILGGFLARKRVVSAKKEGKRKNGMPALSTADML